MECGRDTKRVKKKKRKEKERKRNAKEKTKNPWPPFLRVLLKRTPPNKLYGSHGDRKKAGFEELECNEDTD